MFILFRKLPKLQKHTHVFFVYLVYSDQIEWYANNITRLIQIVISILRYGTGVLTIRDRGACSRLDFTWHGYMIWDDAVVSSPLGNLVVSSLWITPFEHSLINIPCQY